MSLNKNTYLEKKIRKYVIATLDSPTLYLKKTPSKKEYMFLNNIEQATKTNSRKIAEELKSYYYLDTIEKIDLVIIPVDISYELIEEI